MSIQLFISNGFLAVGESTAPTSADPIAMMEFYMKRAAQEEKKRQPKQSKDEMPPPASLQGSFKIFFLNLFCSISVECDCVCWYTSYRGYSLFFYFIQIHLILYVWCNNRRS